MMMAVGFAVGGDMHQLRPRRGSSEKPLTRRVANFSPLFEQLLKGDGLRDRAVVEEKGDRFCRWACCRRYARVGIDLAPVDVLPVAAS